MKKTLRNFIRFLVCFLLIQTASSGVSAKELGESKKAIDSYLETNELPMPSLSKSSMSKASKMELETLDISRQTWLKQTIRMNEEKYNQEVNNWFENDDYYVIEFEPKQLIVSNKELPTGSIETSDIAILSVEYVKPESVLLENTSIASTIQTKIINYYAWSDGYYTMGSKSANTFQLLVNLAIAYTPIQSKLAGWVVGEATGVVFDTFDKYKPVDAETKNKYFYINKAGAVYKGNMWYPVAHVGSRRTFAWSWSTVRTSTGEPIVLQNGPKNGNEFMPPTNYDDIEFKPNWNNHAWIIDKALETHETGGYWNCYGIANNPL